MPTPTGKRFHRTSIRLKGYDYSASGAYFVTICAKNRQFLFGNVVNGEMILNNAGKVAESCWREIPNHYPHAALDVYVIMPNHVHGIIIINNNPMTCQNAVGARHAVPLRKSMTEKFGEPVPGSIPTIIRSYKSAVTKKINELSEMSFWRPIWQRNYYERVIRDEPELNRWREYIIDNPANWARDQENPDAKNKT